MFVITRTLDRWLQIIRLHALWHSHHVITTSSWSLIVFCMFRSIFLISINMNKNKCGLYQSSLSKNYSRIRRIHSYVEIPIFWPFSSRPSCFSSWVVQVPDRENKWTLRKFLCSTLNFHWVIDKYRCKKATWAIEHILKTSIKV